jgi:hypothetical protein
VDIGGPSLAWWARVLGEQWWWKQRGRAEKDVPDVFIFNLTGVYVRRVYDLTMLYHSNMPRVHRMHYFRESYCNTNVNSKKKQDISVRTRPRLSIQNGQKRSGLGTWPLYFGLGMCILRPNNLTGKIN